MSFSKYKNADLVLERMKELGQPPRSVAVPPGSWFQSLLAVIQVSLWLPPLARVLGLSDFARRVVHGCMKCNKRRNMMNYYGWRGLPRLLCSREFWFGKQRKEDVTWQKEQLPERRPTTVTS